MPFSATAINVMIAAPNDVDTERHLIREIIHEWNAIYSQIHKVVLLPSTWESHASPLMGDRPQSIINKQILNECDLLVAVFWARLGSPTGVAPSGTVEEIQRHVSAGKPTMVYFSQAPIIPAKLDQDQYRALCEFHTKCEPLGIVWKFGTIDELRKLFTSHLALTINRQFKDIIQGPPVVKETIIMPTGWLS